MKNIFYLLLFGLIPYNLSFGFELVEVSKETRITKASSLSKNPYIDITEPRDIRRILVKDKVTGYIPFNKHVGILSFSILAPQKTKFHLKWDNDDSLYSRQGKLIKFRRAGDYKNIAFNATKVTSGNIYLYNSKNELLKTIKYEIKKQRSFSQSIRANIRQNKENFDDEVKRSSSINYSIHQRVNIGEPRWSGSIGIRQNSSSSESVNLSVGYSW